MLNVKQTENCHLLRRPLRAGVWNRLTPTLLLSIFDRAMALLLSSPALDGSKWTHCIWKGMLNSTKAAQLSMIEPRGICNES